MKSALAHIHAAVLTRPFVDALQPSAMHVADITGGKAVVFVVLPHETIHCGLTSPGFYEIHLAHSCNAEKVAQHAAARAGLEFRLRQALSGITILHATFVRSL